ncbi:MAG: putative nucleic acid-binding Zn-ribbon protein [Parvicella sp.]|jgi:predicted  nucleic acid-binding Zn-ribbon protein
MANYEDIVKQSHVNLGGLNKLIEEFDEVAKRISNTEKLSADIPVQFEKKFIEIVNQSQKYVSMLQRVVSKYVETSSLALDKNWERQSSLNDDLQKSVANLDEINLEARFDVLYKSFVANSKSGFDAELEKLDQRSIELKNLKNQFTSEVNRLEKVDLDKGFSQLQKTLSDLFSSLSTINLNLTKITSVQNDQSRRLNNITDSIDTKVLSALHDLKKNQNQLAKQNTELLSKANSARVVAFSSIAISVLIVALLFWMK